MTWSPNQYLKFESERFAPFDDLMALVERRDGLKVIDLGCGTGELTLKLAASLADTSVLGIDNSASMLEKAQGYLKTAAIAPNVTFELRTIEDQAGSWDLIFSNAAIHWVENHDKLLTRLFGMLNTGGQLAVQLPSGVRNKAQLAVMEVAESDRYLEALGGWKWRFPALPVHEYAEILFKLGGQEIVAFEKVYPHVLADGEAVYNWVAGTTVNAYLARMPEELAVQFKTEVRQKVMGLYPDQPAFFPFRRIFFSAKKA